MGFTKTDSSQQLSRQIAEDSQRHPTKTEMLSTSTPDTQIQVWNEKRLKNNNEIYSRIHSTNERFLTTGLLSPGDDIPQEPINPFTPIVKCAKGVSIGHGSLNLRRLFYGTDKPAQVTGSNYNPGCYMWVVNPVPGCTYHWKIHGTGPDGSSLGHLDNTIGTWTNYHTPTLCIYAAWGETVSLYTGSTKIDSVMVQVDNASYYVIKRGDEYIIKYNVYNELNVAVGAWGHSGDMVWFEDDDTTHSASVVSYDYVDIVSGSLQYGIQRTISESIDYAKTIYWPWYMSTYYPGYTYTFIQTYMRQQESGFAEHGLNNWNPYVFYNAGDINNQARISHHKPVRWNGGLT